LELEFITSSAPSAEGLSFAELLPGDFPITERVAAEIVSLPMFPTLTSEQQARIVDEVRRFVESNAEGSVGAVMQLETAAGRLS